MNKKIIKTTITISFISMLLLAFVLAAGCSSGGFFKGKSNNLETYNFRSGTKGLSMTFVDGMPPKQLFIGTDFSTAIKLKNEGAFDVQERSKVWLSVPDEEAFMFKDSSEQTVNLRGKSLYTKEGEEDLLMFPMRTLCFPGYDGTRASVSTNYTRKIKASSCYYYETTANADLCIDTRAFQRTGKDKPECQMKEMTLSGGQGGPVGVTKITPTIVPQSPSETEVILSISMKKLAGSDHKIFDPDLECHLDGANQVAIDVQMGGQALICEPSTVKLKERDSVGTVCKKKVNPSLGAFKSPITVNMKYYVQQSVLKDITVEPPPGYSAVNCEAIRSRTGTTN